MSTTRKAYLTRRVFLVAFLASIMARFWPSASHAIRIVFWHNFAAAFRIRLLWARSGVIQVKALDRKRIELWENINLPTKFDPEEFKKNQSEVDALVDYAAKVQDVVLLEEVSKRKKF